MMEDQFLIDHIRWFWVIAMVLGSQMHWLNVYRADPEHNGWLTYWIGGTVVDKAASFNTVSALLVAILLGIAYGPENLASNPWIVLAMGYGLAFGIDSWFQKVPNLGSIGALLPTGLSFGGSTGVQMEAEAASKGWEPAESSPQASYTLVHDPAANTSTEVKS